MNNVQVKERPILFSGPMVRAILEGRKTQTRRVVKPLKTSGLIHWNPVILNGSGGWSDEHGSLIKCPYGKPGDRLYVRETFYAFGRWETKFSKSKGRDEWHFIDFAPAFGPYRYMDTPPESVCQGKSKNTGWWKRPSLFMPRAASRIVLEITDIRVERLQDISEQDAIAEGLASVTKDGKLYKYGIPDIDGYPGGVGWEWQYWKTLASSAFMTLWHSINGPESWNQNPFAWVVEFKKI